MAPSPIESANSPQESAAQPALAHDLYCLKCGYNLRGLPGADPIRCPECGHDNPLAMASMPAEEIQRALRRMETLPAVLLGCLLIGAILAAMGYSLLGGAQPTVLPIFALSGAALAALVAVVCAVAFWRQCRGQEGWLTALAVYLIAGLTTAVLLAAPVIVFLVLFVRGERITLLDTRFLIAFMVGITVAAALALTWKPLSRCAKGPMERLQRERAIELAQAHLHWRKSEDGP